MTNHLAFGDIWSMLPKHYHPEELVGLREIYKYDIVI